MATTTKFHDILKAGVDAQASDWHIREGVPAILRVHGELNEIAEFVPPHDFLEAAVKEICRPKELAKYDEHGDADFAHAEEGVGRFRVNLHRQRGMMALTFRHIKAKLPNFNDLGLPEVIQKIATDERGIILVTGTTGSGKSTTLAAMLEYMNSNFGRHIITVEDPIEYHYEDKYCVCEQREVGPDTSSFDSALIHALRQDQPGGSAVDHTGQHNMLGALRNAIARTKAYDVAIVGHHKLDGKPSPC